MKYFFHTAAIFFSVLLNACNREVYTPMATNAPTLKEKHEFKATVTPNNAQLAYAITDHFALIAAGQFLYNHVSTVYSDGLLNGDARGGSLELGAGYFGAFGRHKQFLYEGYAGGGFGNGRTITENYKAQPTDLLSDYELSQRNSRFFLQGDIAYINRIVDNIFSLKYSVVNFGSIAAGSMAAADIPVHRQAFLGLQQHGLVSFLQPAYTVRVGYRYVKAFFQVQLNVPLNNTFHTTPYFPYFQQTVLHLGATIDIAKWHRVIYPKNRKKRLGLGAGKGLYEN